MEKKNLNTTYHGKSQLKLSANLK